MIAFILLNYNHYEDTIICVESIQRTTKSNYRIVIVDNESKNDSFDILQSRYKNVENIEVIQSGYNYGYGIGNNIGIMHALKEGFDYGIISNTDIIFLEGSADAMVEALECCQERLIIAPEILDIHRTKQFSHKFEELTYGKLVYSLSFMGRLNRNKAYKKLTGFGHKEEGTLICASGCCFAFAKTLLDENGLLFDSHTFLGYEEAILSQRVKQKKGVEWYLPSAEVIHDHKTSPKQLSFIGDAFCNCSEMFYAKNYLGCGIFRSLLLSLVRTMDYLLRGIKDPHRLRQFGDFLKEYFPTVFSHNGLREKDRIRYEKFMNAFLR